MEPPSLIHLVRYPQGRVRHPRLQHVILQLELQLRWEASRRASPEAWGVGRIVHFRRVRPLSPNTAADVFVKGPPGVIMGLRCLASLNPSGPDCLIRGPDCLVCGHGHLICGLD